MHATRLGSRVTIGVFGHYGNKNLGDEAIIEAVFQGIRRHLPNARIETFSAYPDDSAERYGVPAHPIRLSGSAAGSTPAAPRSGPAPQPAPSKPEPDGGIRAAIKRIPLVGPILRIGAAAVRGLPELPSELAFMARSYRNLKGIDLLMVTGSNQFLDNFGGPSGFPYTLLKWSVLAKLAGIPIVFVSVGAGPIFSPLSMAMIRAALLFSSFTSLRDVASRSLIEDGWLSGIGHVYPDLAHGLDMDRYQDGPDRAGSATARATIGINPMAVYDRRYWYTHDDSIYRAYVAKLAELTHRLTERGNPVFLFPTQVKDENVIEDVLTCMREAGYPVDPERLRRTPRTVYELMDIIDSGDVIVATRFHGTVLSLLAGKPTLGLCYYRKAADLLGEMGLRPFARLVEEFDVDEVLDRLGDLERDAGPIGATIQARGEEYRTALDEQYRAIFRPLVDRVPELRRSPAIRRARTGAG